MSKINQKECINVCFSNGPGIFNERFEYPVIDEQKTNNGPTSKVVDIQGPQAHVVRIYSLPERKELIFDTDDCPYSHIAFTKPTFKEES